MQNQIEIDANVQASLHERERLATLYGGVGLALTRRGSLRDVLKSCAEVRERLAGNVESVLSKGVYSREELLREIRELALRSRTRT